MSNSVSCGDSHENIAPIVQHPELLKFRELLGVVDKIHELTAWIQDASASVDPLEISAKEAHIAGLFQSVGIDPDSRSAYRELYEAKFTITQRQTQPKPIIDIPEPSFFTHRITEILRSTEDRRAAAYQAIGSVTLIEVAEYGHTEWKRVGPRGRDTIGEYIHDVATIMADPVSYHLTFARAGLGVGEINDHMAVSENWAILNGRHRSLAAYALGSEFVAEANMNSWIDVGVGHVAIL